MDLVCEATNIKEGGGLREYTIEGEDIARRVGESL